MDRAYSSFKAAWSKIDLNQSERNPNNDTLCQKKWSSQENWLVSIPNEVKCSRKAHIGENRICFSLKGTEFIKIKQMNIICSQVRYVVDVNRLI